MRKRPLCLVFLGLIILVSILDLSGIMIGVPPDVDTAADIMRSYDGSCIVAGTISDRNKTEKGYSYILEDAVLKRRGREYHIGRVRVNSTTEKISAGAEVRIYGRLSFYEGASCPGGFNARKYYLGDGIYSSISLRSVTVMNEPERAGMAELFARLREKLSETYAEAMGEDAGGIMSAMVTGDRSGIDEETRINYSVSGLSHLLAISGLHVGIIGAALLSVLLMLGLPRVPASLISVAFLFFYCLFAGSRESTMRAFVMFAAAAAAVLFRKSYDSLSALSLAGIILIMINPYRIFRTGFILSFAAVAGLAVLYPAFKKLLNNPQGNRKTQTGAILKAGRFAAEGALVWLSVNLATIPVVLRNYSEFPVYSAAANILLVPVTEIILLMGIAGGAAALLFPSAGKVMLFIPCHLIRLQEGAGEFMRGLPGSVWITGQPDAVKIVIYYTGLAVLLLFMKKILNDRKKEAILKKKIEEMLSREKKPQKLIESELEKRGGTRERVFFLLTAFILMSAVFIRVPNVFAVTALDVGQGDCIVITSDSGKAFMIDGGSSSIQDVGSGVILPYLKNKGIAGLEGIFITHNDADHINGISELLKMSADGQTVIKAKRVFMPYWMEEDPDCSELIGTVDDSGAEIIWLKAGDSIKSSGIEMKVLSPDTENGFTGNDGSLVLGIRYSSFSGIFTGDLGGEAEDLLVETVEHYSILKAGHHGSAGSTSAEFLKAVSPDFCIISAPRRSSYGHPSAETLERLRDADVHWLQTGLSGALTIKIRGGSLIVEPYRS